MAKKGLVSSSIIPVQAKPTQVSREKEKQSYVRDKGWIHACLQLEHVYLARKHGQQETEMG